jgi:hypothetical protein
MKLEKTTAILVGLIVVSLTTLVALGKITGGEYLKMLVATIVPACFPALAKLAPKPPPDGPSVLDPDETPVRLVPTVRPIRRTGDELLAVFRGADTLPPPPEAA